MFRYFIFVFLVAGVFCGVEAKVNSKRMPASAAAGGARAVEVLNCTVSKDGAAPTSYSVRSDGADIASYSSAAFQIDFLRFGDGFIMNSLDKNSRGEMSLQVVPNQDGLFFMDLNNRGLREGTEQLRIECRIRSS